MAFRDLIVSIIGLNIWPCVCISYNVLQSLAFLVSQFQALTWGILALLGILVYTGNITLETPESVSDKFLNALVSLYFDTNGKCMA